MRGEVEGGVRKGVKAKVGRREKSEKSEKSERRGEGGCRRRRV